MNLSKIEQQLLDEGYWKIHHDGEHEIMFTTDKFSRMMDRFYDDNTFNLETHIVTRIIRIKEIEQYLKKPMPLKSRYDYVYVNKYVKKEKKPVDPDKYNYYQEKINQEKRKAYTDQIRSQFNALKCLKQ